MRAVKDSLATPLEGEVGENEKDGMGSLVVLLLAERARSEGWRRSGQLPFLLAEPPR